MLVEKKVFFMRHGRALINTDYERLGYEEFMKFLLKKVDPPLAEGKKELENSDIVRNQINIDVIYHSPIRRAKESAEFIKTRIANSLKIDDRLAHLVDEVKFSESIISETEFNHMRGLRGCRNHLLKKWFAGDNAESFQNTIVRINELRQMLIENDYENILIITHAWLLRLIHLYYTNIIHLYPTHKENVLEKLLLAPIVNYGEVLEMSLLYPGQFCKSIEGIANIYDRKERVSCGSLAVPVEAQSLV